MRFFSKFVFICNLCFVIVMIFRWVEVSRTELNPSNDALRFQPLVSTLAILGYGAIIFNFVFNVIGLLLLVMKRPQLAAKWLIWINFLFLLLQVYYFKLF